MSRLATTTLIVLAFLGAGTSAASAAMEVPDPPTPHVEIASVVADTAVAGSCLVTYSWGPAVGGMVDYFQYAVTDYRPDVREDSWRDQETSTTGTTVQVSVHQGTPTWVTVTAENVGGARSASNQAGTDSVSC